MKRKYIVIAFLLSCLTATLFLGATSITTNSGPPYIPYDPWLDTDDDGRITILDIKRLKMAYDSSGDPTRNVNVTNWPTPKTSKIMLVYNQSLTVPSDLYNYIYLTTFDVSGYAHAYIMANATGSWQDNANIYIYVYDNNFGIQTGLTSVQLRTTDTHIPNYGAGASNNIFRLHSTNIDLYLQVYNSNVGFDGLLTIVVFLTN